MAKGVSKKKSSKAKPKSQKKKSATKKKVKPIKKKSLTRTSKKVASDRDEFSDEDQKFNQEPPADGNGFDHEEPVAFPGGDEPEARQGQDGEEDEGLGGEEDYGSGSNY